MKIRITVKELIAHLHNSPTFDSLTNFSNTLQNIENVEKYSHHMKPTLKNFYDNWTNGYWWDNPREIYRAIVRLNKISPESVITYDSASFMDSIDDIKGYNLAVLNEQLFEYRIAIEALEKEAKHKKVPRQSWWY